MRKRFLFRGLSCEAAIGGTAFILRAVIACIALRSHTSQWFFSQASELRCLAESLRNGLGFSSPFGGATGPSAFLAPGYPALIAAIFYFFGSLSRAAEAVIMLLQVVFGTLTVAMILRVARSLFGRRAALIAGTAAACSLPLVFVPTIFWETSFSIFFSAATLSLLVRGDHTNSPRQWAWVSLLTIAGAAVNPSLLTITAPLWGLAWWKLSSATRRPVLVAAACCILVLSLWPIRNWRAMHAFIPTRTNMGYELWQGNRPGGDGFFSAQLHPNTNAAEFSRYAELGETGYMQEKSRLAKQTVAANPRRFVLLNVKRFFCFWSGFGLTSSGFTVAYTIAGTMLGLLGLARFAQRSKQMAWMLGLPLALFPLPYYVTHPDVRFRLVLDPILLVLAAYAVTPREQDQTA